MPDIFIGYADINNEIAVKFAQFLESAKYTTWYYMRDSVPGVSYLIQTGQAIEECQAVLLLISVHSLGSHQVTKEVVRAHETAKPFFPVLLDVSHLEFQNRQPEWREVIGATASISLADRGLTAVQSALLKGLKAMGLKPSQQIVNPEEPPLSAVTVRDAFFLGFNLVNLGTMERNDHFHSLLPELRRLWEKFSLPQQFFDRFLQDDSADTVEMQTKIREILDARGEKKIGLAFTLGYFIVGNTRGIYHIMAKGPLEGQTVSSCSLGIGGLLNDLSLFDVKEEWESIIQSIETGELNAEAVWPELQSFLNFLAQRIDTAR
jgi:hypothetical protein